MKSPLIALTTDFGEQDPFVGIMKGVIAGIAPRIPLVDITHAIPPGDVQRGAIVLWQSAPYFPPGTVFLSVVDPGVGTDRKPIILYAQQQIFVGPDNGLFSYLLAGEESSQAWELVNFSLADLPLSATFHGRDVFAPSAAQAALGVYGSEFGPECRNLGQLPFPALEFSSSGALHGEVISADRFGNLLTSLGRFLPTDGEQLQLFPWLKQALPVVKFTPEKTKVLLPAGQSLPIVETFAQVPSGECATLVGSTGLLEIVANHQSAADILKLKRGERILLKFK